MSSIFLGFFTLFEKVLHLLEKMPNYLTIQKLGVALHCAEPNKKGEPF
jgi:hypothetical protein